MESRQTREVIEALLFSSNVPLKINTVLDVLGNGLKPGDIRAAVAELNDGYEREGRAFSIVEIAGGIQLLTRPEYDSWIKRLQKRRQRTRLSRAGLETLAIIAYRQPLTRPEIEEIRGVDAGGVISTLLERGLIRICGRAPGVGRPILYGTTPAFLDHFGLRALSDLPRMEEIEALLNRSAVAEDLARELGGEPSDFAVEIEANLPQPSPGSGEPPIPERASDIVDSRAGGTDLDGSDIDRADVESPDTDVTAAGGVAIDGPGFDGSDRDGSEVGDSQLDASDFGETDPGGSVRAEVDASS